MFPLASRQSTHLRLMLPFLMRMLIFVCLVLVLSAVVAAETALTAILVGGGAGIGGVLWEVAVGHGGAAAA